MSFNRADPCLGFYGAAGRSPTARAEKAGAAARIRFRSEIAGTRGTPETRPDSRRPS
jgi:hypothetical protein